MHLLPRISAGCIFNISLLLWFSKASSFGVSELRCCKKRASSFRGVLKGMGAAPERGSGAESVEHCTLSGLSVATIPVVLFLYLLICGGKCMDRCSLQGLFERRVKSLLVFLN